MPKEQRPYEELDEDAVRQLRERHENIKANLRKNLATLITLSSGAFATSVALFERIAPKRLYLWIVVVAWLAFGLTILTAIAVLAHMTKKSMRHQNALKELYKEGKMYFFHFPGATPGGKWLVMTESFPGEAGTRVATILFTIGAVSLAFFAVLNLLAK
jgi:hypothetical protein